MKRVVVLGGGESGVGTALLGKQKGYQVWVSDNGPIKQSYKDVLLHHEIAFEENGHTKTHVFSADLIMKSPGIPDTVAIVQEAISKGIPVISEIEFASKYTDACIVGITGSNGKTTTTMLTYHLLQQGGLDVVMGGNIGDSFAAQVAQLHPKHYVLELSSFQLDGIVDFAPHIAMITNITPDHLDRYAYDFEQYVAAKFKITKNQKASDYLIYDADDAAILKGLERFQPKATLVPFSLEKELKYGAFIKDNNIHIQLNTTTLTMSISKLSLQGKHNTKNAMAATMAAQLLNIRNHSLKESLSNFEGVEHRLEHVQKVNGIQFINDSKATNVNATFYALECMEVPTVWIVGGVDKGNDYSDLLPLVQEKVKAIVCLGLDNEKIKQSFGNVIEHIVETAGAEEAVKVAYKLAHQGDAVLLSPACASFDLFENYEDRGRQFKKAIKTL